MYKVLIICSIVCLNFCEPLGSIAMGEDSIHSKVTKVEEDYRLMIKSAKENSTESSKAGNIRIAEMKKVVDQYFGETDSINDVDELRALLKACDVSNDLQKLFYVSQRMVKFAPTDIEGWRGQLRCKILTNGFDEQLATMNQALAATHNSKLLTPLWGAMGIQFAEKQKPKEAIFCLSKYIDSRFELAESNIETLGYVSLVVPELRRQYFELDDQEEFKDQFEQYKKRLKKFEDANVGANPKHWLRLHSTRLMLDAYSGATEDLAATSSLVKFLGATNISNVEESVLAERIQAAFTLQANFSDAWEDLGNIRRQIKVMQASTQFGFSMPDSEVSKAISNGLKMLIEKSELERAVRSLKGKSFSIPDEDETTVICVLGNDRASFARAIGTANRLFDQFNCKVAMMPSEKLSLAALSNALKKTHTIRGPREPLLAMDRANFSMSLNAQTFWLVVNKGQCKRGVVGSTAVAETHLLWQVKKWTNGKLDPAKSN